MISSTDLPIAVEAVVTYIQEQASGVEPRTDAAAALPRETQDLIAPVGQLLLAVPSQATNAAGVAARAALVNNLERAVPGRVAIRTGNTTSDDFEFFDLFFPKWSAVAYRSSVASHFAESAKWWNDFATAVLCDSIHYNSTEIKPQLLEDDISDAVKQANGQMFESSGVGARWYAYVYSVADPTVSAALAQLGSDLPGALQLYQATLCSVSWQQYYLGMVASGNLVLDWYWYHHWVKQLALGASVSNVSSLAASLPASLLIPSSVSSSKWPGYDVWMSTGTRTVIDHRDIDADARAQILYKWWPPPFNQSVQPPIPEYYSDCFTDSDGPGKEYREIPSSCFAAGALVQLADGAMRPIEAVRPGELVATPAGARRVAYVSMPLRGGRNLHRFEDGTFRFSNAHPFAHAGAGRGGPSLVCSARARLSGTVPTLGAVGLARLESGASLLSEHGGASVPAPRLVCERTGATAAPGELLYDLVLEPELDALPLYHVGDERRLYVVASETPLVLREPWAAIALIQALRVVGPALGAAFPGADRVAVEAAIRKRLRSIAGVFLPSVTAGLGAAVATPDRPDLTLADLPAAVRAVMVQLATAPSPGDYGWRLGRLLECLILRHGEQTAAAIERGFRHVPLAAEREASIVAISVHEVVLFAEHPAVGATTLALQLELLDASRGVTLGECAALAAPRGSYAWSAPECYLPLRDAIESPAIDLVVEVATGAAASEAATVARFHLPPDFPSGGILRCAELLRDASGATIGRIAVDLRALTEAQVQVERDGAARWDDAAKQSFANRLGRAWGAWLLGQLSLPAAPD